MRKILVVGGSGFVGSYLMKEIKADNLDLKEGNDICNGIHKKYKVIIFLACNQGETIADYHYNHKMYLALEDYRKRFPRTHLVYFSSAVVYHPISTYSQTKRLGEVFARRFKKHTILRPSNIYGHGDGHGASDRFMQGEKVIYGNGKQLRDWIAVEDVVSVVQRHIADKNYGIFNVSTGIGITMNQTFKMFGEGKPIHKNIDVGVMGTDYVFLCPGRVYEDS